MSEMKCPCCGSEQSRETFIDRPEVWSCGECLFQCSPSHLLRISAAMELAKAKCQRERIRRNVFNDWDEYDENILQAERRVLEVFK